MPFVFQPPPSPMKSRPPSPNTSVPYHPHAWSTSLRWVRDSTPSPGHIQDSIHPTHCPPLGTLLHPSYPPSWSWTTKAGPNVGKTFSVPTVSTSCRKDSHKVIQWIISIFHSFKSQLAPQTIDQTLGQVLPAYVRINQKNMLLHFRAQQAHLKATPPNPHGHPNQLSPLTSLWNSKWRLQHFNRNSMPFMPYMTLQAFLNVSCQNIFKK